MKANNVFLCCLPNCAEFSLIFLFVVSHEFFLIDDLGDFVGSLLEPCRSSFVRPIFITASKATSRLSSSKYIRKVLFLKPHGVSHFVVYLFPPRIRSPALVQFFQFRVAVSGRKSLRVRLFLIFVFKQSEDSQKESRQHGRHRRRREKRATPDGAERRRAIGLRGI